MSEPYHIDDSIDTSIPIRLKNILKALSDYHEYLLQSNTLSSQSPAYVKEVEMILRSKSSILKNCIRNRIPPPYTYPDPKLNECLNSLYENMSPWSPEIPPLSVYWCEMMFEQHPFTIRQSHINNLYKNSLYEEENGIEKKYTEVS